MRVWTILTGVVVLSWAGLGWALGWPGLGWAGLWRTRDNGQGGHQMSSRLGWAAEDERQWAGRPPSDEQQAGLGWAGLAVTHIRVEAWAGGERTDM